MTWEPLLKPYAAESVLQGIIYAHTYHAPDIETAEKIATDNGWTFLGEVVETVSEADIAMFDRDIRGCTIQ